MFFFFAFKHMIIIRTTIHYDNAGIILSLIKAVIVVLPSIFPVFLYVIIDKLFIQGSLPLVVYLSITKEIL